jgi:LmbE family N-acetylglucosaminyl deacetylase
MTAEPTTPPRPRKESDLSRVKLPLLVVSPHLDDAVLSCSRLLVGRPGSTVLTALAGSPPAWDQLTPWDRLCGFGVGDDVIAVRLGEDRAALGVLGATQQTIEACDGQYDPSEPRVDLVRSGIQAALDRMRPGTCAIPLGLQHPDHQEVRQIALSCAATGESTVDWMVYEDLPYGRNDPDGSAHAEAVAAIRAAGFRLSDIRPRLDPDMTTKVAAVACYASQLLALRLSPTFDADIEIERYWSLRPV